MDELMDIDQELGELIVENMEAALAFNGWSVIGAKYDERRRCVRALLVHDEDSDVHHFFLKMKKDGRLAAYNKWSFPAGGLLQYFDAQKTGFILTADEERLKNVFRRVMTAELALELVEAGMLFERASVIGEGRQ